MHTIKGTIKTIGKLEKVSAKFSKRTLVIEELKKDYPQLLAVEFTNDKIDMLNGFRDGDSVEVSINIMSKEWQGKYFTNLKAWKITKGEEVSSTNQNPDRDNIPF